MSLQRIFLLVFFIFLLKNSNAQSSPFDSVDLLFEQTVYFDFGKNNIRSDAEQSLLVIVDSCQGEPDLKIKVEAHTDFVGSDQNNQILSQKRAASVKAFLDKYNLGEFILKTSVFGEKNPIADNNSEAGRQQNRRATVSVFSKKKMTIIEGKVVDKDTGEGMQAKILFRTRSAKDSMMTKADGSFQKPVEENTVVGIDIFKEGYFFETQMLKAKPNKLVEITIPLAPVEVGESVVIKNLYYVGNKAVLLKSSEPELPKVLKFMQLNKDIKIQIEGHINHPFVAPENLSQGQWDLSTNRAKLVFDYLVEHNISRDRMSFKGYGNKHMVYPKARDERKQAKNRRVEIKIIAIGINEEEVADEKR